MSNTTPPTQQPQIILGGADYTGINRTELLAWFDRWIKEYR